MDAQKLCQMEWGGGKILILQRRNLEVGVFSDYIVFLKMIEAAVGKNYIPIIDRKTYKTIFFPADDDINTWESFFEQPYNYTLDDIDHINMDICIYHIQSAVLPVSIMYCQEETTIAY